MTKWREDRTFEIMTNLSNDSNLRHLFDVEIQKSEIKYPRTEFFDRLEKCYEKAKLKANNENTNN
jgi:hypothetical protein